MKHLKSELSFEQQKQWNFRRSQGSSIKSLHVAIFRIDFHLCFLKTRYKVVLSKLLQCMTDQRRYDIQETNSGICACQEILIASVQ